MQKERLENGRARQKKFNESQQLAVWKRRAELNPTEPVNMNTAFIWRKNTFDKTYKTGLLDEETKQLDEYEYEF